MAADRAAEVEAACAHLAALVEPMLSPMVPQARRVEAYSEIERFKQSSPLVVECALALARPGGAGKSDSVRHFGLGLLEETIRLRWNEMSPEQKFFIKESVMAAMAANSGIAEGQVATFIKDATARLVVEIAKREWPQQWPTMLQELDALCGKGEAQTELVMLVMLRLAEDVVLLQTLEQQQRRKEIHAALVAHMEQIFAFLLQLLEKHYKAYAAAAEQGGHFKACQAVLATFTAFVEWSAIQHTMANDRYLVRCLCHLLSDDRLRENAAECLLAIVSWKAGKAADRAQLLSLFETAMMAPLFAAAEKANAKALMAEDERDYNFLKKLVQILAELGGQLCYVWVTDANAKGSSSSSSYSWEGRPANLDVYLNAMLAFAGHPSQSVNMTANELWNKFFRHAEIAKDELFKTYVPKWAEAALKKAVKVGNPCRSDHPSCAYSKLDFDEEHEFSAFFAKYRVILFEGVRIVSALDPPVTYHFTEAWLKEVLSRQQHQQSKTTPCTTESPEYLELEAISQCLDNILSKLSAPQLETFLVPALALAQACLDYTTPDPALASVMLSCVSALFPAVSTRPDTMLLQMMNKIFACVTFTGGAADMTQVSRETRMLRRHGCALLVKMSMRQPRSLLPMFDHLRNTAVQMRAQGQVMKSEFSTLVEALVLISNEFGNYATQSAFVKSVSEPVCVQLRELQPALETPFAFADFVGLAKPAGAGEAGPQHQENRSQLHYALNFVLAVVRRSACPADDIAACRAGGFVVVDAGGEKATAVSLRNPSWDVAAAALRQVLTLAKSMNGLWSAEGRSKLHPDFSKVLEMQEAERNNMCEVGNREENRETKTKTPLSRMQTFVLETFENNYHILNQLCSSCGIEFYRQPDLAAGIVGTVFHGLRLVPDYRLRVINRFVKTLVNKCPSACYSAVLAPVLQSFLPYMYERMGERWKYLAALRESPSFDEDNADSQEVMDDVVCRHLAREFLDALKAVLTSGGGSDIPLANFAKNAKNGNGGSGSADHNGETTANENKSGTATNGNGQVKVSELGQLVLAHETLGQGVVLILVESIQWPDSLSSIRASTLLELVLPPLVSAGRLSDADASNVYYSILRALHELGRHEGNYIALVQLAIMAYEALRPRHPCVVDVLAQVPGCNADDLKKFDARVVAQSEGPVRGGEKAKKDMFKKLIAQFIVKDVSNLFKHDVVIKNLPSLQLLKPPRQKTPSALDEKASADIGLGSLFAQNGQL